MEIKGEHLKLVMKHGLKNRRDRDILKWWYNTKETWMSGNVKTSHQTVEYTNVLISNKIDPKAIILSGMGN